MTWEKKNLVTQADMSDIYQCSECGHKEKYVQLEGRAIECPKCKPEDIYGCWSHIDKVRGRCQHCNYRLIEITRDHPNGKYLYLKRFNHEVLIACPKNCGETTGIKPGVKKRPILK
jgi:DNA-directed RNA polymerase subunit RPC12/RpoP